MAYYPQQYSWSMPQNQGLIWVDGEAGAKAYQLPAGWPANTPIALWDTNDTVIYLKSHNQGMPNPLQKARYQLEEYVPRQSGAGHETNIEAELKAIRDEIKTLKEAIE